MPDIPDIQIRSIEPRIIPEPYVYAPPVTAELPPAPIYQVPGCANVHRDAQLNPSLLRDDPNGVGAACPEGEMPSYNPMDWNPRDLRIIEAAPVQNQEQEEPPAETKPQSQTHRQRIKSQKLIALLQTLQRLAHCHLMAARLLSPTS